MTGPADDPSSACGTCVSPLRWPPVKPLSKRRGKNVAADLEHRELHHEDETHLDTNPYITRMWHRRGQQTVLPAAGTNRRLTTFGSVEVFGRGRVEVLCADQSSAGFQ